MTQSFRELMARDGPAILAGAHNGLSARIVEDSGFDAVWASSFEISAANAVPDAGILGMGECLPIVANICDSAAIPTLVDVDTGYGNAMNVVRILSFLKTPSGRYPGHIIPENPIWHRFPPRRRVRDHRRGRDRRSISARAGQIGVSPI